MAKKFAIFPDLTKLRFIFNFFIATNISESIQNLVEFRIADFIESGDIRVLFFVFFGLNKTIHVMEGV